jgi:hypothetical protein
MSSLNITKFQSTAYLTSDGEPEPKEEKPVEKPAEEGTKATWKPGGYIPTRASWHSVRGRIERLVA